MGTARRQNVRVALDTNVLVYGVTRQNAAKRLRARDVMRMAAAADAILPLQALAECYHVIRVKQLLSHGRAVRVLHLLRSLLPTAAADPTDLDVAFTLVERYGLQFWDSMLIATAGRSGCDLLISEDMQDGVVYAGVEIANPFPGRALPKRIRDALDV
jgi:predicted nucleic acid-binding protein